MKTKTKIIFIFSFFLVLLFSALSVSVILQYKKINNLTIENENLHKKIIEKNVDIYKYEIQVLSLDKQINILENNIINLNNEIIEIENDSSLALKFKQDYINSLSLEKQELINQIAEIETYKTAYLDLINNGEFHNYNYLLNQEISDYYSLLMSDYFSKNISETYSIYSYLDNYSAGISAKQSITTKILLENSNVVLTCNFVVTSRGNSQDIETIYLICNSFTSLNSNSLETSSLNISDISCSWNV